MFFTSALQVVYKTTGGRIWNKRWGLPRLTRTRKENRRKDIKLFNQNLDILKAAAYLQPEQPVRLYKQLPQWQIDLMRKRLEAAQYEINLQAAGVRQQRQVRRQQQQRQLVGPPVDPQLQQRLNQQEVTRIRQQQLRRFQQQQQQQQPPSPSQESHQQGQQQQQQPSLQPRAALPTEQATAQQ